MAPFVNLDRIYMIDIILFLIYGKKAKILSVLYIITSMALMSHNKP